jgi:hypothetical protein
MNCPVCGKEAKAHIVYCAKCAVYVYEKYWTKHAGVAHKK